MDGERSVGHTMRFKVVAFNVWLDGHLEQLT